MPTRPLRELFRCRGPRRAKPPKTPQNTPESSAPQPCMGYVSSQWHTRQPHTPQQLAATSWRRSHPHPTTERAVSVPRSTEGKTPPNPPKTMAECSTAAHGPWAPQKHRRSASKSKRRSAQEPTTPMPIPTLTLYSAYRSRLPTRYPPRRPPRARPRRCSPDQTAPRTRARRTTGRKAWRRSTC